MTDTPNFADVFSEDFVATGPAMDAAMLDRTALFSEADEATTVGAHVDDGGRTARFEGDTSELPAEVCWALQELVAAPHVTENSKRHWPVIEQYERVLRSRLSELGLILEMNREYRYAFTRQAEDPSPNSRAILRSKTLSLAASALALYLYNQYVVAPDAPIVDRADMVDHMLAYRPTTDSDEVGFRKKTDAAIKQLEDASIIKSVRGNDNRFLVYSVITAILTADQVAALDARYLAIARGERIQLVPDEADEVEEAAP